MVTTFDVLLADAIALSVLITKNGNLNGVPAVVRLVFWAMTALRGFQ
jgi:hypothetical protein